ncbi:hypothetical protein [Xenorhabdus miraniensis]|uniref:Bacteriophage protein n=1 Tax=Xenorhabdus miraniensis TaxID=351674 RepID=A0A2D0JLI7_9GAMM|nr:hypothetical protein [Xenorhabdus miraniensis]PHM47162.1 bacteriophage protein [Xenorhabdus miraniensis]
MSQKLAHMKKLYDELGQKQIKVGFFEHSKYPDGTSIAYVATIQELGHGAIPPRPFMRPAMQENRAEYASLIQRAVNAAIKGNITIHDGLNQVGAKAAGDVQRHIRAVQTPPLSMVTLLMRKRRKQTGFVAGGKEVGRAYRDANFVGPRRKGDKTADISGVSTKPLVDEGLMLQAVTFAVEDK